MDMEWKLSYGTLVLPKDSLTLRIKEGEDSSEFSWSVMWEMSLLERSTEDISRLDLLISTWGEPDQ